MGFEINPEMEFGKYRIVRRIGRGGMADVYEAEDTELHRRVALKLLPPEFARDPERVARFMKEVRNSASLQHPGIVPVYDVGDGDGCHFYTMQLLTGGDLKQRIQSGMTPDEALSVLAQVAEALGAAHAKGVVHRDVKPENVMFDGEGRAILTDLGIAKAVSGGTRMTKTGMSIGTPHYMSPEQARGKDVDCRSDIYSLGIMFYEMLMGRVPYDAEESFAVGLMHINDPVPLLPSSFEMFQDLLNGMMAKESEERISNCSTVVCGIGLHRKYMSCCSTKRIVEFDLERYMRGGDNGGAICDDGTIIEVVERAYNKKNIKFAYEDKKSMISFENIFYLFVFVASLYFAMFLFK